MTAIAAGYAHSLALKQDGSVIAWGCGSVNVNFGQCAVPAAAASGVTAIAAGHAHDLALKQDGSVIAWGCGGGRDSGQCSVPAAAEGGVTAIAAGYAHSLALKQDGSVIAWGCGGLNDFGQCSVPAAAESGVTAIAAANATTTGVGGSLALKADGSVVAWGCGGGRDAGQCTVPAAAASSVTAIAAGTWHSLALKKDGSVVAWGCGFVAVPGGPTFSADAGQCTVPAAASGARAIAAGQFHSLALLKASQSISFGALADKTFGDPDFAVSASASSGLTVSLTTGGNCTVSGSLVHLTGAGSCTITASQSGDATYNAAANAARAFAIAKASETISFAALANRTFGDPDFAVSATASSGLAVVFAASGNCTVSDSQVHLTSAGSCTITASQPGDATYNAAADTAQTIAIAKANQTLSFGALASRTFGDPDFAVSASASSGLAVSLTTGGNCTSSGSEVHLTGAGSCTITGSQAGDANYNAAPDAARVFAIAKASETIFFAALANRTFGDPDFAVSALASSGLAVSFAASGNCTVSGSQVHLTGAGSCTITASQAGDANYNAAPEVAQAFAIARVPCRVPKVVGKPLAAARLAIAKRHCRVGRVGHAYSRTHKRGTVISQSRRAGTVLPADSRINLFVSRGRRVARSGG